MVTTEAIEALRVRERIEGPTDAAAGLPTAAYTSEEWQRLERSTLFARQWFALGFVHDVPNPGDARPVMSAAGRPLILARDGGGEIRVLHNYCRHRGMKLLDQPAEGLRNIVCPYHAWSYALDGRLQRVPHRHGIGRHENDPADLPGLETVRHEIWNGVVFVDLSGVAPALERSIGPLAARWSHYDFSQLVPGASLSFEVEGNWKLAIENFIDIYHVPYVHPSLNQYNAMKDHYFIREGDFVVGQGSREFVPTDAGAARLPTFPNLTADQVTTLEAISVFPNMLITVFADNLRIILVEPTGPGSCRERVEVFFVGEEALAPGLADPRQVVVERFPAFNREDMEVVRRLQVSFETSAFEQAHFSAFFDANVHQFQSMVGRACVRP